MKRCAFCNGRKWGLVRHYHYRLSFCTKRCKLLFAAARNRRIEQERQRWLVYLFR